VNLAFQALVIFAVVLPGIILKRTYRDGFFWNRPRDRSAITEEVAYSLVLACALHAAYVPLVSRWSPIDLRAVTVLLLGQYGKDSELLPRTVDALTAHPGRILLYFAVLYAASAALGLAAHAAVRRLKWDLRYRAFRFSHQWHYLLRGDIASFPESNVAVQGFDFISLAGIVDTGAGTFLYVGVLDAFYFDNSGALDLLVLTGATRRRVDVKETNERDGEPPYVFIDAEYLYLKYAEMKNVSIRYVTLPPEAPVDIEPFQWGIEA
jgi:hypothetical protein